jgi:lipid-binding SYLF domain-containing protein
MSSRSVHVFRRRIGAAWLSALLLVTGCGGKPQPTTEQKQIHPSATAAGQMVELGRTRSMKLLNNPQAEGIRNIVGGASGIFIAPNLGGGSLILGVDSGTGFLMRRHGTQWSDPVFYSLTQTSAGFQIGVKNAHVIVLLMTDTAVKEFTSGSMKIGGSGGITVGTYGISVSGAGALDSGLELLIISSSEGLSLGGGVATIDPNPAKELNQQAYGPDPDLKAILSVPGEKYVPAAGLRNDLTAIVSKAWGLPTTRPAPATTTTNPQN